MRFIHHDCRLHPLHLDIHENHLRFHNSTTIFLNSLFFCFLANYDSLQLHNCKRTTLELSRVLWIERPIYTCDRLKVLRETAGTRPAGHKFYARNRWPPRDQVKCELLFNDRLESNTVCGGCPGSTSSRAHPSSLSGPSRQCRRG